MTRKLCVGLQGCGEQSRRDRVNTRRVRRGGEGELVWLWLCAFVCLPWHCDHPPAILLPVFWTFHSFQLVYLFSPVIQQPLEVAFAPRSSTSRLRCSLPRLGGIAAHNQLLLQTCVDKTLTRARNDLDWCCRCRSSVVVNNLVGNLARVNREGKTRERESARGLWSCAFLRRGELRFSL